MKLSNLIRTDIKELVERWHYRFYAGSSFQASPMAFAELVNKDVRYAIKKGHARAAGFTLLEILAQQINFERDNHLYVYEEYKKRLSLN